MNELFEVPNLDGMNVKELAETEYTFHCLAQYANLTRGAMFFRETGFIQNALESEQEAQEVYDALPTWARW